MVTGFRPKNDNLNFFYIIIIIDMVSLFYIIRIYKCTVI